MRPNTTSHEEKKAEYDTGSLTKSLDVEVSRQELLSNYDEFVNKCEVRYIVLMSDGEFQKRFENCKMETQEL